MEDITLNTHHSDDDIDSAVTEFISQQVKLLEQKTKTKKDNQSFKEQIARAITTKQLGLAILLLMEQMDFHQNIDWYVSDFKFANLPVHQVIIRDARHCIQPKEEKEPYFIMAINNIRDVKALLLTHKYNR